MSSQKDGAGVTAQAEKGRAPAPEGLVLGPALIERTAMAVEAECRRHKVYSDLYLLLVNEVFAHSAAPSRKGDVSEGQVDVASCVDFNDGAAVRASALGGATGVESPDLAPVARPR